jgi:hypothetical protein
MVAGDAVNTAARVQAAAEPGQVLTDGATHRLAGSAVGFADAGEHRLKGKAEPQRLWRATRVLSAVGGAQRVDGLEAPLTGRDAELRTIKDLFHAAADRRVPRLVLVSGPAGVGKSRLGWEFEKYVDGLAPRCGGTGAGACPTGRAWRSGRWPRSSGSGWASPRKTRPRPPRASWPAGLDRFVPDPGERAYAGVRLGRLLGVAFPGTAGLRCRGRSCSRGGGCSSSAGRGRPGGAAGRGRPVRRRGPAGLPGSPDRLGPGPAGLRAGVRPAELGQARPGFGAGRNRSMLTLDPLDPASMDQLVDALVPGMPAARVAVTSQAQGLPLFAVETVRSLIDRDIVQPVEGVYRLTGDIGELAVPDSLHALLAARLDALDPASRRLVSDAAVLGTTFPAEALIAVSGQDEPSVRAALADLVRREVLSVSADPLSPERGSYRSLSRCCARSPTTPCPAGTARPGIWPWPRTCVPSSPTMARKWPT